MLGIQKISMNYINHPFAKYMLMLIREDPTLDEAAEREGCAPRFGLNSNGGVCSAHEIAVVLGWLNCGAVCCVALLVAVVWASESACPLRLPVPACRACPSARPLYLSKLLCTASTGERAAQKSRNHRTIATSSKTR